MRIPREKYLAEKRTGLRIDYKGMPTFRGNQARKRDTERILEW